jgi:hypothetical protein
MEELFEFKFDPQLLKVIVQRILTGVKTRVRAR